MKATVTLVAAALVCAAAAVTAHAASAVRLVEARSGQFPQRAYVLTLPRRASLAAGTVRVTENGQPVAHLEIAPAGQSANSFGTAVLLEAL